MRDTVTGLENISAELDRDVSTVKRWISLGLIAVRRSGPFPNSPFQTTRAEINRLLTLYGPGSPGDCEAEQIAS